MVVHKIEVKAGVEPRKWKVVKFADFGMEEFSTRMLELPTILEAGMIEGEQRDKVKHALGSILMDGLMPSFSKLREIRASTQKQLPLMDSNQLYEDLARKLWKSYKELMQQAVKLMGFDIGFLFKDEKEFQKGLKEFRNSHPLLGELRQGFEKFLEDTRQSWQNELSDFRNTWVEHQTGDVNKFQKFYKPDYAEALFDATWRTIADILPFLLEVHLPDGVRLIEQHPDDPEPRWLRRFRYDHPAFRNLE
jgi:hypothetical protein